jgi:hypothetical protein
MGRRYGLPHEDLQSGIVQPTRNNVEALLGIQYQLFQFDCYSILSQLLVFPGLSDAGRVCSSTQNTLSIKLTNNFHYDLSFWDNSDSGRLYTPTKMNWESAAALDGVSKGSSLLKRSDVTSAYLDPRFHKES